MGQRPLFLGGLAVALTMRQTVRQVLPGASPSIQGRDNARRADRPLHSNSIISDFEE